MVKPRHNGKWIVIERDSDVDDMLELYCVCGHPLKDHSYGNTYGSTKTYETGRCLKSNHCLQFKLQGRVEAAGQYNYV